MSELQRTSKDFRKEDRARLLEQYAGSGLDYREFAKEHNINPNALKNWIWISKRAPGARLQRTPVERKKIVETFLSAQSVGMDRGDFARVWGISENSLNSWLKRYEEFGADGLMNGGGKRKPDDKRVGSKVPEPVQAEILRIKKEDPSFGLKKIKHWLYRFRGVKVSEGSIRKTIRSNGLKDARGPRKKRRSTDRVRRFERARPMQMWQSDITQFTMGPASMRVYLTVFMDDHSRYIVSWRLMSRQTSDLVVDAFRDGVVRFGKPEEVLTDQGRQYFAWRGKSDFEKLLEKEGIKHVVSRSHHPQTLGKCERFWETVQNEFWTRVKPQDLEEARLRLKHFIDHYNHHRPHQGVDGHVPADRFFGVASDVREVIEKTVEQNALSMALGELPKAPAFLIGQVGEQRIAFHGSGGSFYLTHENIGDKNGGEIIQTCEKAQGDGRKDEVPSHSDTGDLGAGIGGGSTPSADDLAGDHGVLDGEAHEKGGIGEALNEAGEILADVQSGDCGNDGGATDPAPLSQGQLSCQWRNPAAESQDQRAGGKSEHSTNTN